ncbi:hypothetical protein F7725_018243 [Dissostichus mawsoni]|uniref:Uncharacterized protein n=1 Tax=Dissostichus mawsoni TaxID=36200 RepID=A0A7J5XQW9_DISMA|nr:hypothetical protein F7725_018243 [Dissostichus mawsoni]
MGRAEDGISEAIKVKIKCGKGGTHMVLFSTRLVIRKGTSSPSTERYQVEEDRGEDEDLGMISNMKPRKATLARDKLYGCFVKSSTLLSGQEQPKLKPKPSSSDDSSSSEEDDQKLDLSSTTKLSDADLMKACGGRTAHKLEQQEAVFMAKWGKKTQPVSAPPVCVTPTAPTSKSAEKQEEAVEDSHRKKKESTENVQEPNDASESTETDVKHKKKKKKKRATEEITDTVSTEADVICAENGEAELSQTTKRKHKKKKRCRANDETPSPAAAAAAESESPEEAAELHTDREHREAAEEEEGHDTEQDCAPKTTKNQKAADLFEEAEVKEEEARVKQKRKKCKKDKSTVDDDTNEEELPPKKKKKKKSKE